MPSKDPHVVLGIEPGSSPDEIKAAWRSLARTHHPDLTGDDPEAARRATTRMAEINAAYAALTRAGETIEGRSRSNGRDAATRRRPAGGAAGPGGTRPSGPPPPPRTRPVTGRLDFSESVRPRNQTTTPPGMRTPLTGHPPFRYGRSEPELRASQPSGPTEILRDPAYVPPTAPPLDLALEHELDFGKFHGHTLGEVAAFEPSYIDWLAGTVARDPEVTAAARVIREELDRQGIVRTQRPVRPGWQSNPFR